ncbi:hypothetical protein AB0H36_47520 [Kribbella sp. NPDC050820]|uniref:hypothetical protein n=1 Tax=Kribbella sp. NPDC050820 TaxID=3155408 RepID=UPI003408011C
MAMPSARPLHLVRIADGSTLDRGNHLYRGPELGASGPFQHPTSTPGAHENGNATVKAGRGGIDAVADPRAHSSGSALGLTGFEDFNERIKKPGSFTLPNAAIRVIVAAATVMVLVLR